MLALRNYITILLVLLTISGFGQTSGTIKIKKQISFYRCNIEIDFLDEKLLVFAEDGNLIENVNLIFDAELHLTYKTLVWTDNKNKDRVLNLPLRYAYQQGSSGFLKLYNIRAEYDGQLYNLGCTSFNYNPTNKLFEKSNCDIGDY